MARPFLTIYTPTYKRPTLLARNQASVARQTIAYAIEQVVVRDEIGIGIDGMFLAIQEHLDELHGRYVYILQDDDRLASETAGEKLSRFASLEKNPPVIICRNRKRGNIYPTFWGRRPRHCHIDLGSYVVRRDVFELYVECFTPKYDGDFDFIDALWEAGLRFAWADFMLAEEQVTEPGLGRPENLLKVRVV